MIKVYMCHTCVPYMFKLVKKKKKEEEGRLPWDKKLKPRRSYVVYPHSHLNLMVFVASRTLKKTNIEWSASSAKYPSH